MYLLPLKLTLLINAIIYLSDWKSLTMNGRGGFYLVSWYIWKSQNNKTQFNMKNHYPKSKTVKLKSIVIYISNWKVGFSIAQDITLFSPCPYNRKEQIYLSSFLNNWSRCGLNCLNLSSPYFIPLIKFSKGVLLIQ